LKISEVWFLSAICVSRCRAGLPNLRVLMLLKREMGAEKTSSLIGRGKRVVLEYVQLARQYHPDPLAGAD